MTEKESTIPESLLAKLYDQTGLKDGSCKGYFLFYSNEEGEPFCVAKFDNQIVKMALMSAVERMVQEDFFDDLDIDGFDDED
jgi:hypothetical protein